MTGSSDGGAAGTRAGTRRRSRRVLYPVVRAASDAALGVASGVAGATGADLVVGRVESGGHSPEVDGDATGAFGSPARTDRPRVHERDLSGPTPLSAVACTVEAEGVDAVVLGGDTSERFEARLSRRVDPDTVVVGDGTRPASVASILVPVAGGPHSGAAVEAAAAVARANDAWVELVHVVDPDDAGGAAGTDLPERYRPRASAAPDVDTRVVENESVADAVIEESAYHDLTVIGAPRSSRLRRLVFGSTAADVRERARGTVVMARRGSGANGLTRPEPGD